jgi:hypothetical protein
MATKQQNETAQKIMADRPQLNEVYLNAKSEFFSEKYLAENSTKTASEIETIKRGKAIKVEDIVVNTPEVITPKV